MKQKIRSAYGRFKQKLAVIKHTHFKSVDSIQKDADSKFADSIKQRIQGS
ncbi:hypothetical protein IT407_05220 [Candidatus Uhrbacteria bacterium]|nr:hypothetical protein [Candidatus Uhrbacteria bacterium]